MRKFIEGLRLRLLCVRWDIEVHKTARVPLSARLDASGGGSIRIGAGCEFSPGAVVNTHGGPVVLGDNCSVNEFTVLYGHGGLKIGSNVRIAAHVVVIPANHGVSKDSIIRLQPQTKLGITIEDDVWIGAGACILDGVTLGKGCVIGAGAVVTRSTDPYSINVGVPAAVRGFRP